MILITYRLIRLVIIRTIPPLRLHSLLTTIPYIGVFIITSYSVLAVIKTYTSRPLILNYYVPIIIKIRY